MLRTVIFVICCFVLSGSFLDKPINTYPEKLSDWKIFEGKPSLLQPAAGIVPYALNTPLFTDYAAKSRFIRLPAGKKAGYRSEGILEFPEGTLLIKNFYYPLDARHPSAAKKIIETRLLIKEVNAWKAVTYVWNEAQTDALLEIAGDEQQVSFINEKGVMQNIRYVVPNQNQCKGCHSNNDNIMPIGTYAAQLNGDFVYTSGKMNQLSYWKKHGMISGMPVNESIARTPVWNDPSTGNLAARARAYLEINCAHCHRREGPAQTSGLFLTATETNVTATGINKPPVAAGKGSGGRMADIIPGKADESIMIYRMESTAPGERMPELGRTGLHKEGIALIKEWINKMKPTN